MQYIWLNKTIDYHKIFTEILNGSTLITKTNSDKKIKQSKDKICNITVVFIKNKADYIIKAADLN